MIDVDKQIEEVMRLVGRYGNLNYQECDADYRDHQTKADVYAQDQKETFAQIEEKLRTLLSSAQSGGQGVVSVDSGFEWDSEKQHHVPTLLVKFEPVPANSPNTAKGWADRDALAALLAASQTKGGAA